VSGTRDVVEDGVSGLIVPVDDEEGLYEALRRLFADREAAQLLGETAARRVERRYSLAQTCRLLSRLYASCSSRAGRNGGRGGDAL
jgi:glycosyltransferase involved in cell wall biosynthesis